MSQVVDEEEEEEDESNMSDSPRLIQTKSPPPRRRGLEVSSSSSSSSSSPHPIPSLSLPSSSSSSSFPSTPTSSSTRFSTPQPSGPRRMTEVGPPRTSFSGPNISIGGEVESRGRNNEGEEGRGGSYTPKKSILAGGKKHRRVASGSGRVHFSLTEDLIPPSPSSPRGSLPSSPRSSSPFSSSSSSFLPLPLHKSVLGPSSSSSSSPSSSPTTSPLSSPRTSPRGLRSNPIVPLLPLHFLSPSPFDSSEHSTTPSSPRIPTSPRLSPRLSPRASHLPSSLPHSSPIPTHLPQLHPSISSFSFITTETTEKQEKEEKKKKEEEIRVEEKKTEIERAEVKGLVEDGKDGKEEGVGEEGERKKQMEKEISASLPPLSPTSSYTASPSSSFETGSSSFQGDRRVKELAKKAALAWSKALGGGGGRGSPLPFPSSSPSSQLDTSSLNSSSPQIPVSSPLSQPLPTTSYPEDIRSYEAGRRGEGHFGTSLPLPPPTPSGQQSHQQILEYISPYSPSSNTPLIMRRPALIRSKTAAVLFPELAAQTKTTGIMEWLRLKATVLTSPTSSARRWWHLALFICICQLSITIPFRLSFQTVWDSSWEAAVFFTLDLISDFFALGDILLLLQTPYNDGGFYVTDARKIKKHYFFTWFIVDFIAILPLPASLVDMTVKGYIIPRQGWVRLPCLLRVLHVGSWFDTWEQYTSSWHEGVKLGKMGIGLLVLMHWMGCLWIGLSYYEGFGSDDWVVPFYAIGYSTNELYLMSFYWAINSVASMGSMREPTNQLERIATIFVGLVSLILVATIIGSIAGLISNLDMRSQLFRRKMQNINLFSNNRRLPEELTARIRNYFVNLWSRQGGIDDGAILAELPANLRTDVSLFMNKDIVQKIPMFSRSVPGFVNSLVPYLKPLISSPGDTILKEGDLGHEMYFISRGTMQVIREGAVVATLQEGDSFGEIALLVEDSRRTATIQSTSYCDLFVLTKSSLEKVLRSFPDQRRIFVQMAQARQGKDQIRSALYNYFHSSILPNSVCDRLADAFIPFPELLPGDVLFRYDQVARAMYYVKSGVLDIRNSEGDSLVQLREGCFFGVIQEGKYTVSAYVNVPSVVFQLTQAAYERVLIHTEELVQRDAVRDFIKQLSVPEAYRFLRQDTHTLDFTALEESEAPWQKPLRTLAAMNDEELTSRLSTMTEVDILEVIECLNQINLKATRELQFRHTRPKS